jgi:purine-binding chemotaxis protein CheW
MPDVILVEAGERRLAVPTARVREVAAAALVTPVPTAPPRLAGLTQIRGQIVPVIQIVDGRAPRPNDPLLLVELGPARAALLVDRVVGVAAEAGAAELVDVGALFDELRRAIAT